jgi:hypothetical protein
MVMMPLSACTGSETTEPSAHPVSKRLKMLLSSFPTTAIPSVSETLALISAADKRAEGVPLFVFLVKTVGCLQVPG